MVLLVTRMRARRVMRALVVLATLAIELAGAPSAKAQVYLSTTLYSLAADRTYPIGGLIVDASGNLYGTASFGGRRERHRGVGTSGIQALVSEAGRPDDTLNAECAGQRSKNPRAKYLPAGADRPENDWRQNLPAAIRERFRRSRT